MTFGLLVAGDEDNAETHRFCLHSFLQSLHASNGSDHQVRGIIFLTIYNMNKQHKEQLDLRAHHLMKQGLTYKEAWQQLKRKEQDKFKKQTQEYNAVRAWQDAVLEVWDPEKYHTLGEFMESPEGKEFQVNYKKD